MVSAENKYKAQLLDKENTWGKPTDEQEKIVAMTVTINSLKRERLGVADKSNKSTRKEKNQRSRKQRSRRRQKKPQRRRRQTNGHGKTSPLRRTTARRTTHLCSPSRARNTSGAPTTIMGQVCGCFITQKTAKRPKRLQSRQPKHTSPPSTRWTAIRIWNDYCARVKCFLGSGWPSHKTSSG